MFVRILGIILPVFSVVALGWLYAARVKPDFSSMNRVNLSMLLPALIFSALSSKEFDLASNLPLIAGAIGVVLGSGLLAWPFAKLLHQDPRTWVPPMMFNNCGNMGLPLAYLSFGQPGLSAMVTLFTISNLLHFTLGVHIVKRDAPIGPIFRSPMVIATFLGFAFALAHPPMPEWLMLAIKMVGDAAIPLMLISLGARLAEARFDDLRLGILGGLVCPLTGIAIAGLLALVLDLDSTQQGLLFIFGSLPPAVLNFMVAEQYRQEPSKVASIVLIGNMMAVLFVPVGLSLALR
ncbi:MAG TPA: AEC family transporter [Casimicrobiaceae bacterium]|nr:AEC family transporter [Casimicrobiaceae bacterium]